MFLVQLLSQNKQCKWLVHVHTRTLALIRQLLLPASDGEVVLEACECANQKHEGSVLSDMWEEVGVGGGVGGGGSGKGVKKKKSPAGLHFHMLSPHS